jgi:hypothetical protein
MNEFTQLNAMSAGDMVRERQRTSARARTAGAAPRRTTRRHLASGLRRIADHLDG